jgi:hypothetical protein
MTLSKVTVTATYTDGEGVPLTGTVKFTPTAALTDTTDDQVIGRVPVTVTLDSAGHFSAALYATDNSALSPAGWAWQVTELLSEAPHRTWVTRTWTTFVAFSDGATQTLGSLMPATDDPAFTAYMPVTGGQFTGGIGPGGGTLTDGATVTIDAAAGNDFTLTLTQNTLLATPLNPRDRQKILVQVIQGGGGGFVLSYSGGFAFLPNSDAPSPVLATSPGSRNYLLFRYDAGLGQWVLLAFL